MKGNGRIGYIMVKEHILGLKEIGMKVDGRMESSMARGH